MTILQTLINFTEKAARIARTVQQDPCLLELLVEEKGVIEKNSKLVKDFKTLADVLIQETLRSYINSRFPHLADSVRGEETSSFTNTLGENIDVKICETRKETANLITQVLNGNSEASNILTEVVYEIINNIPIEEESNKKIPLIQPDNIGIWIDPIDSTAEYIHGQKGETDPSSGIYINGLPCVTVLVGVYDKQTGYPVAGVVNQPFAQTEELRWKSQIHWGVYDKITCAHSSFPEHRVSNDVNQVLVISGSEESVIQIQLKKHFKLLHVTGAGYKSLTVIQGLAGAYFCSKSSTYRWDTCAPHGILRSLGGGIISFKSLIALGQSKRLNCENELRCHQFTYAVGNLGECSHEKLWCNKDGLVAYRNPKILLKIFEALEFP